MASQWKMEQERYRQFTTHGFGKQRQEFVSNMKLECRRTLATDSSSNNLHILEMTHYRLTHFNIVHCGIVCFVVCANNLVSSSQGRNLLDFLYCKNINSWKLEYTFVQLHVYNGTYVSLRLCVQNRRKKWNFPLNFRTAAYPELLLKGPSFHVIEWSFPNYLTMQTC